MRCGTQHRCHRQTDRATECESGQHVGHVVVAANLQCIDRHQALHDHRPARHERDDLRTATLGDAADRTACLGFGVVAFREREPAQAVDVMLIAHDAEVAGSTGRVESERDGR
jgi:hypothetical protein